MRNTTDILAPARTYQAVLEIVTILNYGSLYYGLCGSCELARIPRPSRAHSLTHNVASAPAYPHGPLWPYLTTCNRGSTTYLLPPLIAPLQSLTRFLVASGDTGSAPHQATPANSTTNSLHTSPPLLNHTLPNPRLKKQSHGRTYSL